MTRGEENTNRRDGKISSPPHVLAASPLFLVWLLTLPALTPLLQPTLTRSADGLLHLYRVVALDQLIRQGVFFPRWLPDMAFGYGLPLFVFYAPLSYYLTEGLHLMGLDMVGAFNASGALALLVAGSGIYLLVKDRFGAKAGVLAGVAYVYAPYQLFNLFSRGSLPVTWTGALFPLAFWAFGRLIRTHQPIYLLLSALLCGAALLMHNISNLLFLPLLILYLGIELIFTRTTQQSAASPWDAIPSTQSAILRVSLALALSLALAAFFWLPATLEKEFAQVQRVITPPDFDYRSNFVSLGQLFSLPRPANTGLLNPPDPLTLGLAQVGLVIIGVISYLFQKVSSVRYQMSGVTPHALRSTPYDSRFTFPRLLASSPPLLFAAIGLVVAVFMMLPLSVGVWDRLPLIAFVQQPHRLLSVTAFLLAILAGAAVSALPGRLSFGFVIGGVSLIIVSAVPLLYPRYYASLPAPPTLTGMMAYERATGAIGTTSFGEYLPIWVQQTPHESPLEPLYQAGAAIERLDRAYLPAGAMVESAVYSFNRVDLTIDAPQPYQAVFHTFYFPGWQATVDGQPAPLAPVTERGLLGVTMPAGQHRLLLQFGETPIRQAANILSLAALVVVIGLGFIAYRHPHPLPLSPKGNGGGERVPDFSSSQVALLLALALVFLLTKTLYLDRFDNPFKRVFDGTRGTGAKVSRQVNFGQQVNLLGYDLDQPKAASGQTFNLTLYWQARQPLAVNYSALAQLVDDRQHLFAGQDNLHPGSLPASRWEPWGFVRDKHAVQVPPGTPPGDYFLVAGLYDPATWARLPVLQGGDLGWSDVLPLLVTVTRPTTPPTLAELGITWPAPQACQPPEDVPANFHPSSLIPHPCLLGATPERETIQRSDFLRVALFWEAVETPVPDYQVSLRFLAADDTVTLAETSRPSFGRYPMPQWAAGERVRDNHALWVSDDLPAGTYRLQVRLLDETGQPLGDWLELGQLTALEVQ